MIDVIVTSIEQQAQDILGFELAREDGEPLPAFSAGAHIDVHLPDGLIRQYSLCNHPEERHRYQIAVLRNADSRGGSIAMHGLQQGVRLRISEPRNLFPLQHDAKRHLLMAGGIGITPILCMAERLAQTQGSFELHYCTRSPSRAAFTARIGASAFADRVSFHDDDDGDAAQKLDAARVLAAPAPGKHLFVCGPNGFMGWIINSARSLGWAEANIHREYFAAAAVDTTADGSFEVKIASTGATFTIG
jgi:vanillate O-demethylase ferredoxin subunit